ncbi:MAG TPA: hypothetical protein VFK02_27105 [Kofleriaceae bacterium]|nr:hypothetical protein [Kofleriaceae bacterium]
MAWLFVIASIALSGACGGGGCGGCSTFEPIPGGFPPASRTPEAAQVRLSSTGLAAIAADPAALIGSIAGGTGGVLQFNAPVNCSGTTPTCCPGGKPKAACGPIDLDLRPSAGDLPRLELVPSPGNARLDVTVRARVKSETDIPINLPLVGDCGLRIDSAGGVAKDITIDAPVSFVPDTTAGTTRVAIGTVGLTNLENEDVALTGGIACRVTNVLLPLLLGVLSDQLTGAVQSTIQGQTCKACPSGQVAECGSAFATACTQGVCMEGRQCLQELGLAGRVRGSALFGALSPGTTGALDLYEVASAASTDGGGLTLGLSGGMQPGGAVRDRCGPAATPPPAVTIQPSAFFQGDARPDTGQPFDLAFGLHASQLAQLAYAGYEGGLLCLTIGHDTVTQLSSATLSLLARSLGNLTAAPAPMAVGLRPQSPPVITLGKNTFVDDGSGGKQLAEPLLDVRLSGAELDFFLSIDDQWIRTFTVVADIHLPIGLQVAGMGQLTPVVGDVADAFTHVSVKNTEAITESPAELAGVFPSLLALVLPQLSGGLGTIALPSLGGLAIDVTDITAVDGGAFLGVFARLSAAPAAQPQVETRAQVVAIEEPGREIARDPARWASARGPAVTLELGGEMVGAGTGAATGAGTGAATAAPGSAPGGFAPTAAPAGGGLEWSYRLDGGTWSAWSPSPRQTVRSRVLWLAGLHHLEVRARQIGAPGSIDDTPVLLEVAVGDRGAAKRAPGTTGGAFHGQTGAGCSCDGRGDPGGAAPLALVIAALVLAPLRRRWPRGGRRARRAASRVGGAVWLAALAWLPGCSCGGPPCGDVACLPGEVAHGSLGRYTRVAADRTRVMVATYDTQLGDLVVADATDAAHPRLRVVDGIPRGVTPTHDGGYRDGVDDPGPDVGAWTSIAMWNGRAHVAYQDRDAGALKFAQESSRDHWSSYVVDAGEGEVVGAYASLAVDSADDPAIAYLAVGIPDAAGHLATELRIARAHARAPAESDWSTTVVVNAPGTCAGLCGGGLACVADPGEAAERCVAPTTDCAPACGAGDACVAGACLAVVAAPTTVELPGGTGLFASLVVLPDDRLAIAYHDRTRRALMLAVETGPGTSAFTRTALDAAPGGDRGMWASAAVDAGGTIHVAYQDALGDQLMYTTWNGAPGVPEVVDDGQRSGDRPHGVGAAAAVYLVDGAPAIAYQDGLTADVYVAIRSGAGWSKTPLATGPLLDGFSISATTGHPGPPVLAWGALDPAADPIGQLVIESP